MDKKKEKELVATVFQLLDELVMKKVITFQEIESLLKLLQKATSGGKNKLEDQKNLNDFISSKNEIKEFLEKEENNQKILMKACQQYVQKQKPVANIPKNSSNNKSEQAESKTKNQYKFERFNFYEKNNFDGENLIQKEKEKLYVLIETIDCLGVPLFTWVYSPDEKRVDIILKGEGKILMNFSQVYYMMNEADVTFQNINYWSMIENETNDKEKENKIYMPNMFDMTKLESALKNSEFNKGSKVEVKYTNNDENVYKNYLRKLCEGYKEKIKCVKTNNKDYLAELLKD